MFDHIKKIILILFIKLITFFFLHRIQYFLKLFIKKIK